LPSGAGKHIELINVVAPEESITAMPVGSCLLIYSMKIELTMLSGDINIFFDIFDLL
jgi:hypothetical protein